MLGWHAYTVLCNMMQSCARQSMKWAVGSHSNHCCCKCRWMQFQCLCPTAQSRQPRAGLLLPALQRRSAGWSPRILPGLPPGPCLAALQRALIRLKHVWLQLSSAGHLLTALQSGSVAQLPPPRVWMRFRMGGCVNPGGALAVGHPPRPLAQVVLYSICLVICRIKMLGLQCYFVGGCSKFRLPSKAICYSTCILA